MFANSESITTVLASVEAASFGSLIKLLLMTICAIGWLYCAPQINNDAIRLRTNRKLWSMIYLISGAVGMFVWVFVPIFWVGLPIFLLTAAVPGMLYLSHRNKLVSPEFRVGFGSIGELFKSRKIEVEDIQTLIRLYGSDGRPVIITDDEASDPDYVRAYNLTQKFLYDLALMRAAEVDLAPTGEQARLRYIIDGVVNDRDPLMSADAAAVVDCIRAISGVDFEQRNTKQKGKISIDVANSPVELEVTTAPTPQGLHMRIRVLSELIMTNLDGSGMQDDQAKKLHTALTQPGIVIVAGGPKVGKTSTIYSLMRKQDAFLRLLVTIEKEAEFDLDNITQNDYHSEDKLYDTFITTTRRDPDFIFIDNCPDAKTAAAICEFAREKTVILNMQAKDTFTALANWAKLVGNLANAVAPLNAITNQMLIRKLCESCKEPYAPDQKMLAKLKIPADRAGQFYQPRKEKPVDKEGNIVPCEVCKDVEYNGRIGVFEILEVTDTFKQAVTSGASLAQLKQVARQEGMKNLQQNTLLRVIDGTTSVQEIIRISQQNAAKK